MTGKSMKYRRERRVQSIQDALQLFFSRHKGKGDFHTAHLWDNWEMVMGEPLWRLALPLGCQDRTLIIGAEDNMLMHELNYSSNEILGRANAFMNAFVEYDYFNKLRFELLQGRTPLYPPLDRNAAKTAKPYAQPRPRPDGLGALMDHFDPESPIGRAYRSYVRSFDD